MTPPLRKRIKRGVRSVVVTAVIRLVSRVPRRLAWAIGTLVGRAAWTVAVGTRRLALRSLATAFPEKPEAERRAIARAMFLHLGHAAAEIVTARAYDRELERYVELPQVDRVQELMAKGRGLVYVTGHIGNWELNGRRIARAGVPNAVIAKAGHDERLNALAEEFRSSGGITTLWRESPDTGRALIRLFRKGQALGILIDQDTAVQNVFVPFFGRLAATPRAVGDLALRFGAPVIVATVFRRGDGPDAGHRVEIVEVPYDPNPADREAESVRITAECSRLLEEAIRRHPSEWVWMHQRWKTQPPTAP